MRTVIRNIIVGLIVSFLGSIPLGWLNLLGFEIFRNDGFRALLAFISGVVVIESFVIYLTLVFAHHIAENSAMFRYIRLFSIVFLLLLAVISFIGFHKSNPNYSAYLVYSPFMAGILASALNVIQVPFWLGWNLYLAGNGFITRGRVEDLAFVSGCVVGTGSGMSCFILIIDYFAGYAAWSWLPDHTIIFAGIFAAMAIFQVISYRKKHHQKQIK